MAFVQPIDLAMILQGAQQFSQEKHQREAMELARQDRAREQEMLLRKEDLQFRTREAMAKVQNARDANQQKMAMAELSNVSPEGRMALEKHQAGLAEDQAQQAKARRAESTQQQLKLAEVTRDVLGSSIVKGSNGEEIISFGNLQRGMAHMQQLADANLIPADEVQKIAANAQEILVNAKNANSYGPEYVAKLNKQVIPQFRDALSVAEGTINTFGPEAKPQRMNSEIEQIAGRVVEMTGDDAAFDPRAAASKYPDQYNEAARQLRAEKEAASLKRAKAAGTTIVNQMPATESLTTATKTDTEQKSLMLNDVATLTAAIEKELTPESFTYLGRGKAKLYDIAQQAGVSLDPEMQQRIEEQQTLASDATFMAYQLIVAWSGKAVTDAERRMLFAAIGDPQEMGYTRYKAAMMALNKMATTSDINKRKALRYGVDTTLDESERRLIDAQIQDIEKRRTSGDIDDDQAIKEMMKVKKSFDVKVRLASRRAKPSSAQQAGRLEKLKALRDSGASEEEIAKALKEI